ncbi:MAG TPA: sigma-70 family RNA polymerase sigma factor [Thermoleophilaceae bacterium]|nr:sigma-70 family RNA polymerase sigma factor [Thermoleophilaceae bacterium]
MSTTQSPPTTDGPKRRPPTPRFAARPSAPHRESDLLPQAIARAKAGDTGALHFLYVRFADDVCGYVASIVRDRHEAEDITQTLFLKLLTKIQRYEQREVPFAAWILRVARNAALDHVRARRALPFEDVRTSDAGREDEDFERGQALRWALEHLPSEQREVLALRHIAGLSPGEIARRLGKTESAVHGLHHRGRAALQAALRELGAAPLTASG